MPIAYYFSPCPSSDSEKAIWASRVRDHAKGSNFGFEAIRFCSLYLSMIAARMGSRTARGSTWLPLLASKADSSPLTEPRAAIHSPQTFEFGDQYIWRKPVYHSPRTKCSSRLRKPSFRKILSCGLIPYVPTINFFLPSGEV